MITLRGLVSGHSGKVVDKWDSYLGAYEEFLAPYRNKPISLLEIGVANGGSLDIWAEYFPNALNIVGCDITPECGELVYSDPRVQVVVGDANDSGTRQKIADIAERYDIIIDDGSHINGDIVKTFAMYYPILNTDGIYFVEDLHTSYWDGWGGGLLLPYSAMALFKRLADMPNHEHWRNGRTRKNYLRNFELVYEIEFNKYSLTTIHSVTFMNSMVAVKSKMSEENKLGRRHVKGEDEHILPGMLRIDGMDIKILVATGVDDSQYDPFIMLQKPNQLGEQHDNPV